MKQRRNKRKRRSLTQGAKSPTKDASVYNSAVIDPPISENSVAVVDYESSGDTCTPSDPETAKSTLVDVVEAPSSTSQERQRALKAAHRKSVTTTAKVVEDLLRLMGAPLIAWMTSVKEARAVREWSVGERAPHSLTREKLQLALYIANFLDEEGETDVIDAWFRGLNPALDDQSPADLIRVAGGDELSDIGRQILAAAREFVDS